MLAEQLQALANVGVPVPSCLHDEDHLIDPGVRVAPDQLRHLGGGADRPAQRS